MSSNMFMIFMWDLISGAVASFQYEQIGILGRTMGVVSSHLLLYSVA